MSDNVRQMQPTAPRHRKLTGIAPWPMILLTAGEKKGKTWGAVEACMSGLVDGGLWFPIGENDPDEYALIPGFDHDRFDLVLHDGTYRGLLAVLDAELLAEKDRKTPQVWVLDSGSRLWDLLSGMAYREMADRLARKAAKTGKPAPEIEQKPAVDLWNTAADRWAHIIDAFRRHKGPVVITARMESKAIMGANGEPTRDKEDKILTHKSLPYDVDAIVELQEPGFAVLTGVRSVKLAGIKPRTDFKDFTVDKLLRRLGVDESVGQRSYASIDPDDKPAAEALAAMGELGEWCDETGATREAIAAEFADINGGLTVKDATAGEIRVFLEKKRTEPKKATA